MQDKLFAWIIPTIKTPELVILQIVGLDAAVLRHLLGLLDLLLTVFKAAHILQNGLFSLLVYIYLRVTRDPATQYLRMYLVHRRLHAIDIKCH